jgi:uncharacterized repeat protein (TIGR02543 family)
MKTNLTNSSLTSLGKVQPRATMASFGSSTLKELFIVGKPRTAASGTIAREESRNLPLGELSSKGSSLKSTFYKRFAWGWAVVLMAVYVLPVNVNAEVFTEVTTAYGLPDNANSAQTVWVDYDNDDDLDLVVTVQYAETQEVKLYQNNNGNFVDVAQNLGLTGQDLKFSVSLGDYDNDGDTDMIQRGRLLRNDLDTTGKFTNVGIYAGYFIDYDNDGNLDMFSVGFGTPGTLYRNDQDHFTKIEGALGLNNNSKHIRSINWADYDKDGDMDVLLVNGRNEEVTLYRNDVKTTGLFTDVTTTMGLSGLGTRGYADGAAWGDYDNDGDLDFYITSQHGTDNRLYRNDGSSFTDVTAEFGLPLTDGTHVTWADYDNDGYLDLYVVTTQLSDSRLFHNEIAQGNGFVLTGEMLDSRRVRWGGSWGDFDNDGDLDHVISGEGITRLYQNNSSQNGNHWLHLKLTGTISNRSAIGATVYVQTGNLVQMRQITSYGEFSSQNSFPVGFGLGNAETVDTLTIKWPNGIEQVLTDVAVDRVLSVVEPSYSLALTKTGNGTITSTLAGITCGADCTENYASGTVVTLTATPDVGYVFKGWTVDCSGTNATTTVTMDAAKNCIATFVENIPVVENAVGLTPTAILTDSQMGTTPLNITLTGSCSSWTATTKPGGYITNLLVSPTSGTGNATITISYRKSSVVSPKKGNAKVKITAYCGNGTATVTKTAIIR